MEKIHCRALIEVLGKPKEHVENALRGYLEKLKGDERYKVSSLELVEAKKQEDAELWAAFAELEFSIEKIEHLSLFCFEYMPSSIDVVSPKELTFKEREFSHFLSDLQSRLHQVDLVAKQVNMQNQKLEKNMSILMKNHLIVLLSQKRLTLTQLSQLSGAPEETLGDYLDHLIDKGKIDLDGEHYYIKK